MTKKSADHVRLSTIECVGAELAIGGIPVSEIALRAGATPFYAYDRALLEQRIQQLRGALPSEINLHYAIKANPLPAVVGFIGARVDGLDVASQLEMQVALNSGMSPEHISFAGPGKRIPELRAAIGSRICLNVESELEIRRAAEISEELGITARVAVRVNPDFELKGSGMKMSGSPGQFGIDAERVPAAVKSAVDLGLAIEGLHIFCGSQNLNSENIIDANRQTLSLAADLRERCDVAMPRINIGGGYGIPYFPGDQNLDLAAVGEALHILIDESRSRLGDCEFVVELGRYITAEAGFYVTRVIDIKKSCGKDFAIVDGGLHHHLANSGNFGQILRKNYPVVAACKMDQMADTEVSIVGPLCTPLDKVADRMMLPALHVGDLIVVFQSGAYGFSASPHLFLSHPTPVELFV
ncbi:MAG: diaminopimelate decarboxylase [Gammaproteobacteria bacterium]|jgi:diaminopimelate decarboxylase